MKKGLFILLFLINTLFVNAQFGGGNKVVDTYASNQLIIKFNKEVNITKGEGKELIINNTAINNLNNNLGGVTCERILISTSKNIKNKRNLNDEPLLYKFHHDVNIKKIIPKLLNTGLYEIVEPNYIGKGDGVCALNPNDLYYNNRQWGLYNNGTFNSNSIVDADIDMEMAWSITTGDSNIIVAVLDAGTKLDHPEFAARLWINPMEILGNGSDDDGNGYIDDINGWDFVNSDNDPTDDHGHGTNVAGILLANGNNNIGYAGVNWNSKLMTCKVLDSAGLGFYSWWASAIYYAVDNGASVINMSLGGTSYSAILEAAVDYAYNNNVVVVASMGNDNNNVIQYPAGFNNSIAVGATDTDNKRVNPFFWSPTSGSSYGSHINLSAPGNYIYGLSHTSNTNYNTYWGGTSQATPLVAGVASLIIGMDNSLSSDSILAILQNTAIDQVGDVSEDTPGWDQYHGYGLLNAYNALYEFSITKDTATICSGSNYTFPDGDTQNNITSSLTDTSITLSSQYCDSTIYTTLIIDSTVIASTTDSIICMGDTITLNGIGASIYTWDNGVIDGVAFTPDSTTTFTVTSNLFGCNSDQITITVNPLPSVTANTSSNNICIGNDLVLYGGGNSVNYVWDNGAVDSLVFSPSITTLYTVLGTDSDNCVNSDTITLFVSTNAVPNISIIASDTNICVGDNLTLSGNGALSYIWNNGISNGVSFSLDSSETFLVTGTDINGCSDTTSIFIDVDTVTTFANALPNQICLGDSVMLIGSGSATTYLWDNGVTDNVAFLPLVTTTYTVIGSRNNICSITDTVTVTVQPVPLNQTITATGPPSLCENDGITLSVPYENGMNYCWNLVDSPSVWNYVGNYNISPSGYSTDMEFSSISNEPYVAFQDGNNSSKITVLKYNGALWQTIGLPGFSTGSAYNIKIAFSKLYSLQIGTRKIRFDNLKIID